MTYLKSLQAIAILSLFSSGLYGQAGNSIRLTTELNEALEDLIDIALVNVEGGDGHERGSLWGQRSWQHWSSPLPSLWEIRDEAMRRR
ncbi:hypothetical protein ACFXTH_031767 [Malus domestica]